MTDLRTGASSDFKKISEDIKKVTENVKRITEDIKNHEINLKEIIELKNKSIPEPKPENKGIPIYPLALSYLIGIEKIESLNGISFEDLKSLLTQRYNFGLEKYGQPLMSEDGRDEVEDLKQEIGDAVMYLSKCLYKGRNIKDVKKMIKILYEMSNYY